MSMVVQHNLTSINSNRMLGITTGKQAKATEKLSSGYKINRAADDAAGLSISEKMRKQIRGLTQASANAQDGISSVQTAEGAMTEVHDMLQRMNELAVKASNGTNSESDRQSIQDEIDQLVTEIDRVAETTKFNEIYLLKGNADGTTSDMKVNAHDAGIEGTLTDNGDTALFKVKSDLEEGDKITIAGQEYTIGSGSNEKSVENYAISTDAAAGQTLGNTTVKVGDSLTDADTGKVYTVVNKVDVDTQDLFTTEKSAFTITHSDGTTESYDVDDTGGDGKLSATDALDVAKQALAAGEKVTLTKDKAGKACEIEVVKDLENTAASEEISIVDGDFATGTTVSNLVVATGVNVAAGDSFTVGGKTTTLTSAAPIAASDVADVVNALGEGDVVHITRKNPNGVDNFTAEFKIGDVTDEVAKTYTVSDMLGMIKDGDDVKFKIADTHKKAQAIASAKGITFDDTTVANATANTVVGDIASSKSDVISKAKALEMIGKELEKASSIGTDEAATVKNNNDGTFQITKGTVEVRDALAFDLHVGADADMTNKITVNVNCLDSAGLGIKGINIKDKTGIGATYAIDAIADAVAKVSAQRSALGAVQNRLEHTISNLDNVVENTTAAESSIRDTDMASQMVEYSKNNILAQAGQAMLAQANQSNQGVLSLLQ